VVTWPGRSVCRRCPARCCSRSPHSRRRDCWSRWGCVPIRCSRRVAGWASTRPQARQFVNHGLVQVNGKRVDIASYRVRKGDVVTLSPKARGMIVIQHNIDVLDRQVVGWLEAGDGGKQVTVRDLPQREHIDVPVREQLIVELYSK